MSYASGTAGGRENQAWMKPSLRRHAILVVGTLGILGLIALLYGPVRHGIFVWDDDLQLRVQAASPNGMQFVFRGFGDWINYFRPLVVLLFVGETRLFDLSPGPMHVVSVGLHLLNTLLVGLLARKYGPKSRLSLWLPMLVFGLHPTLIEPVSWIGCQFELVLVLLVLVGLLCNEAIRSPARRAAAVSAVFLLAAGVKEAAACFPMLICLLDLAAERANGSSGWKAIREVWRRQRAAYIGLLTAGIIYLAIRHWALGQLLIPIRAEQFLSFARLQKVCFTYLEYWKLIVWPMSTIGPLHQVNEVQFRDVSLSSLSVDIAAVCILACGVIAFHRRRPVGTLILAATIALVPVLNVLPLSFSESLYHDRYAATAIAIACVLLPSVLMPAWQKLHKHMLTRVTVPVIAVVWFAFAIVNVRVTVPLWSNEVKLWQWVLRENPNSVLALEHLLSTYMQNGERNNAHHIADELLHLHESLDTTTLVNVANLEIEDGNLERGAIALERAKDVAARHPNARHTVDVILAIGLLREKRGEAAGAEEAYRDAMTLGPLDAEAPLYLALLLARQGRTDEARQAFERALSLSAPSEHARLQQLFRYALASKATDKS